MNEDKTRTEVRYTFRTPYKEPSKVGYRFGDMLCTRVDCQIIFGIWRLRLWKVVHCYCWSPGEEITLMTGHVMHIYPRWEDRPK